MTKQKGIGLSELLIALFLASFIMMALMRHYLNTKQHYRHVQTAAEQSIELQLVTELIRDSSRRAGFTPCLGIDHLKTIDQRHDHKKLVALEVGPDGATSLQVNRMSEQFNTVKKIVDATHLIMAASQMLHPDQSLMIADCYHAEVQTISQIKYAATEQTVTLTKPLAFAYHAPIYSGAWLEETYFIRQQRGHEATLFYHLQHTEELTTVIHSLSAHIETYQGRKLVQIHLGLDNAHQLDLETMVRQY